MRSLSRRFALGAWSPACLAFTFATALALVSSPALAQDAPDGPTVTAPSVTPPSVTLPPEAPGRHELRWRDDWARVRPLEMGASAVLLGGIVAFQLTDKYREPHFGGGILFDESVRSALRAKSAEGRERAQTVGTALYFGSIAFTVADALVGVGLVRGSPDVLGQVLLIDVEAYAITGFLQFSGADVVRRKRPYTEACEAGQTPGDPNCEPNHLDSTKSFFAGHVAVSFTSAGLTCAHHYYLETYGAAGDASVCGLTLASAFTVAYTRIATDKHYATDVVTGMLVGSTSGFLVPTLLHYRSGPKRPPESEPAPSTALFRVAGIVPAVSPTSVGVAVAGLF